MASEEEAGFVVVAEPNSAYVGLFPSRGLLAKTSALSLRSQAFSHGCGVYFA